MKKLLLLLPLLFCGCSTLPTQDQGHQVASFIDERSGFIEDAIASMIRAGVYYAKDGTDKARIIKLCNIAAANLNDCINSQQISPEAIREAVDMDEPYFDNLFQSVAMMISNEIKNLKTNGYVDAAISILKAATKGIADGTAQ